MSISTLRRQVKNVAYNFSDAQVKVREATSNDPWGPRTALMSEIADMTHNPMAFTEIMPMLWKRLNDHGKNWRHVYKSLVLLDYLIKSGSEKVAHQCRENIYSIETLKDFQHIEENHDQGLNVREKAKQMVSLLNDEERLRNERARFLLTRKRYIQNGSAISSDGTVRSMRRTVGTSDFDSEFEEARPSSIGEEEMQLQIAIALSREECEKEEELRKSDAMRLQIALDESNKTNATSVSETKAPLGDLLSLGIDFASTTNLNSQAPSTSAQSYATNVNRMNLIDPWSPQTTNSNLLVDPNSSSTFFLNTLANNDPWAATSTSNNSLPLNNSLFPLNSSNVPVTPIKQSLVAQNDPWTAFDVTTVNSNENSHFNNILATPKVSTTSNVIDLLSNNITAAPIEKGQQRLNVKTPETFLGENSSLVNLDNLMGPTSIQAKPASNPFMIGSSNSNVTNPFAAQQRPSPSLHEMIQAQRTGNLSQSVQQTVSTSPTNPFA